MNQDEVAGELVRIAKSLIAGQWEDIPYVMVYMREGSIQMPDGVTVTLEVFLKDLSTSDVRGLVPDKRACAGQDTTAALNTLERSKKRFDRAGWDTQLYQQPGNKASTWTLKAFPPGV